MGSPESVGFNWFDALAIGVVLASSLFAYARGLVHEVLSVGAWVGAIFATIFGFPHAQPYARELISSSILADIAAGVAIFVLALAALSLTTKAISRRVKASALNALDRSLGFAFGALRGAVLICVASIGLNMVMTAEEQPDWVKTSKSRPAIDAGSALLMSLIVGPAPEETGKESKSDLNRLLAPTPKGSGARESGAYAAEERQHLQRLIESTE